MIFDIEATKKRFESAVRNNSEQELLAVIKENSFLLSDIYSRQYGVQPNFSEVPFGRNYRCDFCWLNDNSDGPEWVLVEVEKPKVNLFNRKGDPSADLNHAVEQVRSWDRYFATNPIEKNRIFGAVAKFRLVLVVGEGADWDERNASIWKSHFNGSENIEIRSMNTFYKALNRFKQNPDIPSFEQVPVSRKSTELSQYCNEYEYLKQWKNILSSNT